MQANRRNVERMAEVVPDSNGQALHHFLSDSPWQARGVMDQVARQSDALLGGDQDSCLLIDETCFAKKGKKSVGVARQWCGRQGKTDNCQVAVFAALARDSWVTLVDAQLYLPQEWTQDRRRCQAAGVPVERQQLRTKPELALEMILHARANGLRFGWVAADGTYGQNRLFLRALDEAKQTFVCDVHRDQRIFLQDLEAASTPSDRGSESLRVDQWVLQQPAEAWQRVWVRKTTQGDLWVEALHQRVWVREGGEPQARCWHLIVTREIDAEKTTKYSFSNGREDVSISRLAYMQRQRYWIERAFQDAKNEAGLDEYQARSWQAWYHHVALVMMAMLFMLQERIEHQPSAPLLSTHDIKQVMAGLLPRRDADPDEVIRQLHTRHRQRQAAIDSAYARQRRLDPGKNPEK